MSKIPAYAAMLVATVLWSAAGPIIKVTLEYLPPATFLFYRFLLICIILLPAAIYLLTKEHVDKKDIPELILAAIFGQTMILLIFWGLEFTSALDAAIIGALSPILTIAAGHYFYKERITKISRIGVILATLGTLLVVLEPILSNNHTSEEMGTGLRIFGNVLVMIFNFSWPGYIIITKRLMGQRSKQVQKTLEIIHMSGNRKSYSAMLITVLSFYIGLVTFLPFVALEYLGVFGPFPTFGQMFTTQAVVGLLYMVFLSSIAAYAAFQWALKYMEASETALFTYLSPVFTLPFAYMLLHEMPTDTAIIGSLIIAAGVIVAEKYKG